jgi:peptidoglycan/xylan/chitin deacetylase (PgdA/CDA1 family)
VYVDVPHRRIRAGSRRNLDAMHAVLTYHAVGPALDRRFATWTVSEAQLSEHLAALQSAGYRLDSLGAALRATDAGEDTSAVVALTFDDGYVDFAERALPALQLAGARSTQFVVTDHVGGTAAWLPYEAEQRRPLMSWDELAQVAAAGTEIGSHGCRHLELDAIPATLAREEVTRSRRDIAERLEAPETFAYPFGYHHSRVRDMVAAAGYRAGCEVGRGLFAAGGDRYRIRRILVDNTVTPERLVARLAGPPQLLADRVREHARPAWRAVRRARRLPQQRRSEAA